MKRKTPILVITGLLLGGSIFLIIMMRMPMFVAPLEEGQCRYNLKLTELDTSRTLWNEIFIAPNGENVIDPFGVNSLYTISEDGIHDEGKPGVCQCGFSIRKQDACTDIIIGMADGSDSTGGVFSEMIDFTKTNTWAGKDVRCGCTLELLDKA